MRDGRGLTGGGAHSEGGERDVRITLFARGSGTDGEVGRAGVRRVQRELGGLSATRSSLPQMTPCAQEITKLID